MTLLLYKPVQYFLGIPVFAYVGVIAAVGFFWMCISLGKETLRDLKERMESDSQDFSYDIKHVHLN